MFKYWQSFQNRLSKCLKTLKIPENLLSSEYVGMAYVIQYSPENNINNIQFLIATPKSSFLSTNPDTWKVNWYYLDPCSLNEFENKETGNLSDMLIKQIIRLVLGKVVHVKLHSHQGRNLCQILCPIVKSSENDAVENNVKYHYGCKFVLPSLKVSFLPDNVNWLNLYEWSKTTSNSTRTEEKEETKNNICPDLELPSQYEENKSNARNSPTHRLEDVIIEVGDDMEEWVSTGHSS